MGSTLARSCDILILLVIVEVLVILVLVVDRRRLHLEVNVSDTFPVVWRLHLHTLNVGEHPLGGSILGHILRSHRETRVRVDPVTLEEGLSRFLEAIEELGFVMASRAHEVVIVHDHVLETLREQSLEWLALEVNMFDEGSCLELRSLASLHHDRVARVNVTAIHILHKLNLTNKLTSEALGVSFIVIVSIFLVSSLALSESIMYKSLVNRMSRL